MKMIVVLKNEERERHLFSVLVKCLGRIRIGDDVFSC